MPKITFITGGSRSGKSSYALKLAENYSEKFFIATAEACDDEMKSRIEKHKAERGNEFVTIEEPVNLASTIKSLPISAEVAVIDCLTVWLGTVMHRFGFDKDDFSQIEDFLKILKNPPCDLIIVSNEVGMGIIPHDALTRKYRDIAGFLNQHTAKIANEVILTVSGIPIKIKC